MGLSDMTVLRRFLQNKIKWDKQYKKQFEATIDMAYPFTFSFSTISQNSFKIFLLTFAVFDGSERLEDFVIFNVLSETFCYFNKGI